MDELIELAGVWLAQAYALYGLVFLFIPLVLFINVASLAAVVWTAVSHSRGRQPWPSVPPSARRWVRLALEIGFGLINPVLYLAILNPALRTPGHQRMGQEYARGSRDRTAGSNGRTRNRREP